MREAQQLITEYQILEVFRLKRQPFLPEISEKRQSCKHKSKTKKRKKSREEKFKKKTFETNLKIKIKFEGPREKQKSQNPKKKKLTIRIRTERGGIACSSRSISDIDD